MKRIKQKRLNVKFIYLKKAKQRNKDGYRKSHIVHYYFCPRLLRVV